MYTAFYGLREKPFALSPDPRFLFLAESHREALAHLLYGIEQREGFITITGEVGTGKTTLCRTLIERLGPDTEVAYLFNPSRSAQELMEAISSELGLPSIDFTLNQLHDQLNRFLLEKSREGRRVLLIVDEAQNLSIETLEQVRLLSNLETSTSKLIQILLLGQPELDRKLDSRELRQLRQRIGVRWSLSPLTAKETRSYVSYRLRVAAGADREIFSRGALREIRRGSRGIPRLVNVLCDRALLAGYAAKMSRIPARLVRQAGRELTRRNRPVRKRGPALAMTAAAALGVALLAFGAYLTSNGSRQLQPPTPDLTPQAARPAPEPAPEIVSEVQPIQTQAAETPAVSAAAVVLPSTEQALLPARAAGIGDWPEDGTGLLGGLLDQRTPEDARLEATNAILEAFGEPRLTAVPDDDTHALQLLAWSGLSILSLDETDLGVLRALNHPALLALRGDGDAVRWVAVRALHEDLAELAGVTGRGDLRVPVSELRRHWVGEAYVIWRPFETMPEVLMRGEQGESVAWLQAALARLGYYRGTISGDFDGTTQQSLIEFQRGRYLEPDGAAGPRTQMVLYDLLDQYAVPRLDARGDAG